MKTEQNSLILLWRTDHETYKIHQPVKKRDEISFQLQPTYILYIHYLFALRIYQSSRIANISEKKKRKKEHLRKNSNFSTVPTYFDPSQKICFYFNLSTTATPSQWSVHSDPRVAFVKRFHCIYLSEERDFFGSSLKQTRLIIRHE